MESTSNPVFGKVGLSALFYGGLMLFVIGPEIAHRTINTMNWSQICARLVEQKAQQSQPPSTSLGKIDMCRLFFGLYGRQGEDYCRMHGPTINGPVNKVIGLVEGQKDRLREWRMEQATGDADTQCTCASSYVRETHRVSWAFYAGTARAITPPALQNLPNELTLALSTPQCAKKG